MPRSCSSCERRCDRTWPQPGRRQHRGDGTMKLTATKATLAALLALAGMPLAANAQHDARPTGGTLGNVSAEPTAAPPVYGKGSKGFAGTPGNRPPITLDAYGSVAYAINHAPTLLS